MAGSPSMVEALALHQSGDLAGAGKVYRKILDREPHEAMALHYLGVIAHQTGKREEALKWMEKSIAASPGVADFHCNLGVVLRDMGRLNESAAALRKALSLRPKYPEALNNLGDVLRQLGRLAEAEQTLRHAIAIGPSGAALKNLGLVLIDRKEYAQAAKVLRDAVKISPQDAGAHKYLGIALRLEGKFADAASACRAAVAADERDADAWFGLGQNLRLSNRMEEACEAFTRAHKLSPDHADVLIGLAATLNDLGEYAQSIEIGCRAVTARPNSSDARYNLSLALLSSGRMEEGWAMYESRWGCASFMQSLLILPQPAWDGSDISGKTIFLRAEQGCGDTIQFARYVPLIAARGAKVILEVQPELKTLLASVAGGAKIIARGEEPGEFDCHLPLLSVPLRLKTTLANVPAEILYLQAPPDREAKWRARLGHVKELKCGIAWAGNPVHRNDANRSLPIGMLAPLAEIAGVKFLSLQKGRPDEIPAWASDLSRELEDFADAAAAISQMDLIISVDTAVAHLAGALGKTVWTMLPRVADWRWMKETQTSPWYPTMRLFRQQNRSDWGGVVQAIAAELAALCRQRNPAAQFHTIKPGSNSVARS